MLALRTNGGTLNSPFTRFMSLQRELDDWFNHLLPETRSLDAPETRYLDAPAWVPPMDVHETETEFRCVIEVPGLRPEDMDVSVEGDVLTIAGEKRARHEGDAGSYRFAERRFGRFARSFRLPGQVDASDVSARYENGLLYVTLPKVEEARPRRIQIEGVTSERQIAGNAE